MAGHNANFISCCDEQHGSFVTFYLDKQMYE